MDPTRAPDFKPPSADEELIPPPDPESKIPKSIPIIPYVLADANSSIDAPFNNKRKKKHPKHHHHHHHSRKEGNDKKHQHIPLNQDDFQPLSAEVSSEDDDADFRSKERYGSDSTTESETRGVQKYQIADLEEVPHGIVRQARTLEDYEFPSHRLSKKLLDPNTLPLVIVACGSFSPITYLHLRMFEMALDAISEQTRFEVIGGYYSPVSDNYQKQGLAPSYHRVCMCELACERTSSWLMVDAWESLQPSYTRTAKVLDHFNHEINIKRGGVATVTGEKNWCENNVAGWW